MSHWTLIDKFYFNVELIAPSSLTNLVTDLQKILVTSSNISYLPGKWRCPVHLTLYSTYSSKKAIDSMISALNSIAPTYSVVQVRINDIGCFSDGSIHLECEQTQELVDLHKDIVEKLNPLRDVLEPPTELAKELSDGEIDRFRKYGDPFALEHFSPHITIVTIDDYDEAIQLCKKLQPIDMNVTFSKIAARIWETINSDFSQLLWQWSLNQTKER